VAIKGSRYKICRVGTALHLYRDGALVDIDQDPERAPQDQVFLWATRVAWAEDHAEVVAWHRQVAPNGDKCFISEEGQTPRL
jgi:hypothetical protein